MRLRQLREDEVLFTLGVCEDYMDVKGNVLYSGDEEEDTKYENEILDRLRRDDVWAWAHVTITASWRSFQASAGLGGCTYADEQEFRKCPNYEQLKTDALAALQTNIQTAFHLLLELGTPNGS